MIHAIKNKTRTLFLGCASVFISYQASAQLNTPTVIASSGNYFTNTNFSNSYTIGEMCLVETALFNGHLLTQGFQQPDCEDDTEKTDEALFIPNGFTPNGDGYNDTWEIPYLNDYPESTIKIFNRWGQEIYSTNGNLNPWNGTFKGNDLPTADYYYIILIEKLGKKLTGTITLKK
jgi:gliding motility-associated-like protein